MPASRKRTRRIARKHGRTSKLAKPCKPRKLSRKSEFPKLPKAYEAPEPTTPGGSKRIREEPRRTRPNPRPNRRPGRRRSREAKQRKKTRIESPSSTGGRSIPIFGCSPHLRWQARRIASKRTAIDEKNEPQAIEPRAIEPRATFDEEKLDAESPSFVPRAVAVPRANACPLLLHLLGEYGGERTEDAKGIERIEGIEGIEGIESVRSLDRGIRRAPAAAIGQTNVEWLQFDWRGAYRGSLRYPADLIREGRPKSEQSNVEWMQSEMPRLPVGSLLFGATSKAFDLFELPPEP